jgi:hypothetical protein
MGPYNPQGQQVQVVVRQGNGIAVAGMVLGILAIVFCWLWFIAGILGILGIIFGAIGISRANRVGTGKGMAITGIVCGVLGMVLAVVIIFVFIRAFTGYIDKELESSKVSIVKLQVDRVATEWYPRWQLRTNEACPKDLMELARAVGAGVEETRDVWGSELKFSCGSEAGLPNGTTFGVYSVGEDLREGTSDDIKSWQRR